MASADPATLQRTPLAAWHEARGARLVPFAGYAMPVQYADGIAAEHRWTREQAGLFDVSHMGQIRLHGAEAAAALETLVPGDIVGLKPGRQRYTVLTAPDGGVLDDLMVARLTDDTLHLVVNAATKSADLDHLKRHLAGPITLDYAHERALLALQGPRAEEVLAALAPDVAALPFMGVAETEIDGVPILVTRGGYTGEDGFEISLDQAQAEALAERLCEFDAVRPIGLGARDSLRLEAGLCLYGQDLTAATSPIEAAIPFAIGKARRPGGARAGGYPGAERIGRELTDGPARLRLGLVNSASRQPVRAGAPLVDADGATLGAVTSGGFSPSLQQPIATGYLPPAYAAPGTGVSAMVRGKPCPLTVTPLPFRPARYKRA